MQFDAIFLQDKQGRRKPKTYNFSNPNQDFSIELKAIRLHNNTKTYNMYTRYYVTYVMVRRIRHPTPNYNDPFFFSTQCYKNMNQRLNLVRR